MLANGTEAVYFSGASDGDELQQVADVSSWIETSIMVFLGEFTNDEDRALLVDVVLGLYGLAYVSKLQRGAKSHAKECTGDALWAQLQKHKAEIFPAHLFGDLVELVETELAEAMAQGNGQTSLSTTERQESKASTRTTSMLSCPKSTSRSGRAYLFDVRKASVSREPAREFALFDRHGFEEVIQASDRLYKQAMGSLGPAERRRVASVSL